MKIALVIGGIFIGGCLLFAIILAIWVMGIYNTQGGLKNQYESKVVANRAIFDNMFKKIDQSAQVTNAQKDAIKEIIVGNSQARAGNGGGSLATSVKEAVPNIDVKVFSQLMNIITGARDEFTQNQIYLVSIAEQYNKNLSIQPSAFILGMFGFTKIDAKIVTSGKTEEAFKTGRDDDIALPFSRPASPVEKR